jgi:hypothetical protein
VTALRDLRADPDSYRIPAADLRAVPRDDAMAGRILWQHMWPAERQEYRRRYLERRKVADTPAGYISGRAGVEDVRRGGL